MTCIHRGKALRMQLTAGCIKQGKKRAVYECTLHGACAEHPVRAEKDVRKIDRAVKPCYGCKDKQES